jgi:hypothetical protein
MFILYGCTHTVMPQILLFFENYNHPPPIKAPTPSSTSLPQPPPSPTLTPTPAAARAPAPSPHGPCPSPLVPRSDWNISSSSPTAGAYLSTSAAGLPRRRRRGGGSPTWTFSDSWFYWLGCPSLLACFVFCGNFISLWTLKSKSPLLWWTMDRLACCCCRFACALWSKASIYLPQDQILEGFSCWAPHALVITRRW